MLGSLIYLDLITRMLHDPDSLRICSFHEVLVGTTFSSNTNNLEKFMSVPDKKIKNLKMVLIYAKI